MGHQDKGEDFPFKIFPHYGLAIR